MQLRQIQLKDNAQVAQVIRTVMPEYDCVGDGYSINDPSCYLETVERMREANGLYQKMGFEVLDGPLGCTGHGACDTRYLLRL